MCFCAAWPTYFGWFAGQLQNKRDKPLGERIAGGFLSWFLVAMATFGLTLGVFYVEHVGRWLGGLALFVAVSAASGVLLGLRPDVYLVTRSTPPAEVPRHIISMVGSAFGLMITFGGSLYPFLSPAVGGGAAVRARIAVADTALSSNIRHALLRPVAIIDRDVDMTTVLVCADSSASRVQALNIQSAMITSAAIDGFVAVPEASNVLCQAEMSSR